MTNTTRQDGLQTLFDDYDVGVPRFNVYVGMAERGNTREASVETWSKDLVEQERERIRGRLYRQTNDNERPSESDLVPLAGPWGDEAGQRTNDVISVTFTDNVLADGPLTQVQVEVHNVYDPQKQRFRYSDVPSDGAGDRYPILDYGRALVLEMGYRDRVDVVFSGMIEKVDLSFPADGAPTITATAVDERWRLRANRPAQPATWDRAATEESVAADVVAAAGLRLVTRGQTTTINGQPRRSTDQDLATFLTERARNASLELSTLGEILFLLPPADGRTTEALTYRYRGGLISFSPSFNASGCPSRVELRWRDRTRGVTLRGEADLEALRAADLISEGDPTLTFLRQPPENGTDGEGRVERVTNIAADDTDDANTKALGILKRYVDAVFTATGELLGDPRVRAGTTLDLQGLGRYSGLYYLTSTTHTFGEGGYHTSFQARRTTTPAEPTTATESEAS